ncbi:metallophosphoesterase [Paenibacillus paridis]|uniref:metallophosphoesterase n=1 Tax=Paenibacillus paridis TaxID=2583376 RepID=UPI00112267C0|nr:metallophosphoesterase [Paenibacillus paridis]
MRRTIVISDIHGYYETFKALLHLVQYNAIHDRLVLLGDYVDGGPSSLKVVQHIRALAKLSGVKAIGGNHDDMFLNWLDDRDYIFSPYSTARNGGRQTIRSFCPWYEEESDDERARIFIKQKYAQEVHFLRNLKYFIEDDHHIYVHAGIDPKLSHWSHTSTKDFRWIRGEFHAHDGILPIFKKIVFGHEVTAKLHHSKEFHPWFGKQLIGIDGGIKFGYQLNALIISDDLKYTYASMESKD